MSTFTVPLLSVYLLSCHMPLHSLSMSHVAWHKFTKVVYCIPHILGQLSRLSQAPSPPLHSTTPPPTTWHESFLCVFIPLLLFPPYSPSSLHGHSNYSQVAAHTVRQSLKESEWAGVSQSSG